MLPVANLVVFLGLSNVSKLRAAVPSDDLQASVDRAAPRVHRNQSTQPSLVSQTGCET